MPECRPQRGAFERWILCSGVEIGAFTGDAATGCGGPSRPNREKPNKYRYIPPAVEGMLEIAMQACQVSSESIRMSLSSRHTRAKAALQNCRSQEFERRAGAHKMCARSSSDRAPRESSHAQASDVGACRTSVAMPLANGRDRLARWSSENTLREGR